MTSVAELVAALRAVLAELADADTAMATAHESCDSAVGQLALAADGTGHDQVSRTLATAADAVQRPEDARSAIAAAVREVERYVDRIGGGGPQHRESGPPSAQNQSLPPAEAVGAGVPPPSYVRRLAAALHVPAGSRTAGLACTQDGTPLHDLDRPLTNGRNGGFDGIANATTLSRDRVGTSRLPLWHQLDVALTHVEGHAAARLRTRAARAR